MTEQLPPAEPAAAATPTAPTRKRGPLGRLGCALGLLVWFVLILSPCLLFTLATQGEMSLNLGSAPGQTARLWLVMEPDERGLGLSLPSVQSGRDGNTICVQTDVRYFLWQGQADAISYCECYHRTTAGAEWDHLTTIEGVCTGNALAEAEQR